MACERLIKNGQIPKEMGRLPKRTEEVRLIADYRGGSVELADAREFVEQTEISLSALQRHIDCERRNDGDLKIP